MYTTFLLYISQLLRYLRLKSNTGILDFSFLLNGVVTPQNQLYLKHKHEFAERIDESQMCF